ncbi:alkaline phosphatase family protein [Kineosporia sp. A_224]|uniref:alkaline phosphatase family protein n=1 Tax=Kineosporia sp. A_224 TaxID=1962180 RepID=UPI000B4AAE4B|nr:alkaline phosphatase family protein [Kineosporia sp. A_224]
MSTAGADVAGTGTAGAAAVRDAAVRALTDPALAGVVDLVAYPEAGPGPHNLGPGATVVVANARGAVRLDAGGLHTVLHGEDPVGDVDPMAFLPYELEVADPSPDNARNAYPDPGRRLLSLFADPSRSPDVAVVHTPRHFFPDEGGHHGEHGSLDVVQSRAPLLLSGAGVRPRGVVAEHARIVDVAPTLLRAAGVPARLHVDAAGLPLDGHALEALVDEGAGRWVVGILWDGAHCSELLHLAASGELPGVARLLAHGTALAGGAVAEFPSITLCNHTSALTGVGPGRHGVLGNVFYDRATGERVVPNDETTWHRSAEWLRPGVATVFETLAAARPGAFTACVDEAVERGAGYSTMQLVRAQAGAGGAGDLDSALPDADASPFVGERAHLADSYYRWGTRVDDAGVAQMLQLWAVPDDAPALTWWSNVVTDAGHHGGGPRSQIARDSFRDADRRLSAFLDHLDRLGVTDDVTFLLTADHGFEGADVTRTGSWRPALAAALDPLGVGWRDEGPGFLYLGV